MADDYYIPGMPQNLQGILYTPHQGPAETKRLRQQHAGNPAMQQRLAVDDRYHQGKGMMQDSPTAAVASFAGSVPYDAAKLAYFHGPKPVKKLLGNISERLFPGEGFNDQTTARPAMSQYKGMLHGMTEGAYEMARGTVQNLNSVSLPDGVVDRLRQFTTRMNYQPTPGTALMPSTKEVERQLRRNDPDWPSPGEVRGGLGKLALQGVGAHAADPIGTSLKLLSNMLQTAVPDTDTRQEFPQWMPERGMRMQAIAPGMKPIQRMAPERKAAHEAEISKLLATWPEANPRGFPKSR